VRTHRLKWLKYLGHKGFEGKDDLIGKIYTVCYWELSEEEREYAYNNRGEWVLIR
jgi:hypothetical protein